jgi:hypothetical protein
MAQTLLAASLWLALAYVTVVSLAAIVAALRAGGRRDDAATSHDAVSVSRFTIPVSIVVPAADDSQGLSRTISALLQLNYPAFEVIVVADGCESSYVDALAAEWRLGAREFFYRRMLPTADVRRIYRSDVDTRLMLIDKARGGYSDALNCGVNLARYRYVMSLPLEIASRVEFDPHALLRVMTAALHDPANVVGAASHVEQGVEMGGSAAAFQRLASLRSLMKTRLAWRHLRQGLGPDGAVVVWRRDAVLKLQGYSRTAADPDLDLMCRMQTADPEGGTRFVRSGEVFGRVKSRPIGRALAAAARRQQGAFQFVRRALQGHARGLDRATLVHFVESELLTPAMQAWLVAGSLAGAAAGWFPWSTPLLAVLLLSFGGAAVTAAALLLRGFAPGAPLEPELRRLLVASPLEPVLYRPLLAIARLGAVFAPGPGAHRR